MKSQCKWILLGFGIAAAAFIVYKKVGMVRLKFADCYEDEDDFYRGDINSCCCGDKPAAVVKEPEREETGAGIEIEVKPPENDIV